jgi:ABC-type glycerol-3-phosphate transport system substrate-binding protein
VARTVICSLLLVALVALTSCGGDSTASGTVADTDISIQTTDIESLSVGTEQQCIERLTRVVDVAYIKEHDVEVDDESSATFAVENAISEVCADIDSGKAVHAAAHDVVHRVGDKLADG